MKKRLFLGVLLLVSTVSLLAQNREVTVKVQDRRGRPSRNTEISLSSAPEHQRTDREGLITVVAQPQDTLYVHFNHRAGIVPLYDATSIAVRIDRNSLFRVVDGESTGEEFVTIAVPKFNPNDISSMPDLMMFHDLNALFRAKYPTVRLQGGNAFIAGNAPHPALVVLDRVPISNFAQANNMLALSDIQSIKVKRRAPNYGPRAVGGAIEIKTRRGGR